MRKTELEVRIFGKPEILLVEDIDIEENLIEAMGENLEVVNLLIEDGRLFYQTEYTKIELDEDEIKIEYEGEFVEDVKRFLVNLLRDKICKKLD